VQIKTEKRKLRRCCVFHIQSTGEREGGSVVCGVGLPDGKRRDAAKCLQVTIRFVTDTNMLDKLKGIRRNKKSETKMRKE
jgi:hypothetical protein